MPPASSPFPPSMVYVGRVSGIFEFFLRRSALVCVLGLRKVGLSAEFCARSNGAIFKLGYGAEIVQNPEKTDSFCKIRRVFSTAIRCRDCAGPKNSGAGLRIIFCID